MGKCLLCGESATINKQDNASRTIYNCQSCGVFVMSDLASAQAQRNGPELAAFFASRKLADNNEIVLVSFEKASKDKDYTQLTVNQILEQWPQTIGQLTDRVLENLGHMSQYPGEEIRVDGLKHCAVFFARKRNYDALSFVIKAMQKEDLLDVNYFSTSFFPCGVTISAKGWDRLSAIRKGMVKHDTVIVFSSNHPDYQEPFRGAVKQAIRECGYKMVEMGIQGQTDKINFELIAQIRRCNFAICSLSNASGSVYYAAGMMRALQKPLILTCHQSAVKKLEFDVSQTSMIQWKEQAELQRELIYAIRALL